MRSFFLLMASLLNILSKGYALFLIWGWHFTRLGALEMPFLGAVAVVLAWGLLKSNQHSVSDIESIRGGKLANEDDKFEFNLILFYTRFVSAVTVPVTAIFFGYIFKLFI